MNTAYKRFYRNMCEAMLPRSHPFVCLSAFFYVAFASVFACHPDFYPSDVWPYACVACPLHTKTVGVPPNQSEGGLSAHDCKCEAGFLCMYYKRVRAQVILNTTRSAFEHDEGSVRSSFIAGVAAAAGVAQERVHIHFVVIRLDHRRRARRRVLLTMEGWSNVGVRVLVTVADPSADVSILRAHLGIGEHSDRDSWIVERRVLVLANPSTRI